VRTAALWSGALRADARGRVHVEFPLPVAFNGRLRLMAVGDRGALVGSAETAVAVRAPLLVQASWPRFAAPGDSFTVPVTVFNRGAVGGEVALRLTLPIDDPLTCAEPERTIAVAAGASATMSFSCVAPERSGVAHARLTARLGGEEAIDELALPVRPASPEITVGEEALASPDHGVVAPLPAGFLPGTVVIDARLAPLPALSVPAGLEYLYVYPHGCAEQTTSGCFPLLYLRDLGGSLAPRLFSADGLAQRLREGIERLQMMQCEDGGLAMWGGERAAWPWASVYATHFLVEARAAGVAVPERFLARLLD
jgi:uncharacterized protein YfaS (alpha-2-macroglobulin family)